MKYKDKYGNIFSCDYNFENCDTLVLSGGAFKCIYFLGALLKISKKQNLNFRNFSGTSCGSVLCTLLCIGYSPIEIFKKFLTKEDIPISNYLKVLIENLEEMLILKGFDKNTTFDEMYKKTGNSLAFVASNISKLREEIFSRFTSPNTPIIIGVKLSCSLPVIFPISKYNNDIFTDGIFFDNFPIKLCKLFNCNNVIAMTTFKSYYDNRVVEFYNNEKYKIIYIPDFLNKHFFLNSEEKFCMFVSGYNYICENIKKNILKRRNSF